MFESKIDVLIPVYNAASTLDSSLTSVTEQTFPDFRIVIVDDGSSDSTPALLAQWIAKDQRIEVFRKPNGGIVDALNFGLERCTAPFVARFDADDISFPERLACQRAYLLENPTCVAVGCAVEHIDEAGFAITGLPQPGPPGAADPNLAPALEPYIIHPFLMARRDAIAQVGGYRHVPNSEDSDLLWRLSEIGKLHNSSDVLGKYRVHHKSVSGASVLNGRIMAVGSQLGALSARRRRDGAGDLQFDPGLHGLLRDARDLASMSALAEMPLRSDEIPRFRLATAIKLLELSAYRPYRLEIADCKFIRNALAYGHLFSAENRRQIRWHVTEMARRLARNGSFICAATLVPPALYPFVIAKSLLR